MNELEEIKARAAERREHIGTGQPTASDYFLAETALDRTIAIAENEQMLADVSAKEADQAEAELEKARAAAKALREVLMNCRTCGKRLGVNHIVSGGTDSYVCMSCGHDVEPQVIALADTEWLEQADE